MRLRHLVCAASVGFLAWLTLSAPAAAQGVITLPSAMPASGPGCQCAPGAPCHCEPGTSYGPIMTSPITTWDPYNAPQAGILPGFPGYPGQPCPNPCAPQCAPRTIRFGIFAEYLHLRPGDSTTIDYALPANGPIVPPIEATIPLGPIATLNPDYDMGFRIGAWWQRTCESQLGVTYTHFESETDESVTLDGGNVVLLALLLHPATASAIQNFNTAAAQYDLEYSTIDIDYRHVLCSDCAYRVSYIAGVRFLHYEDELSAQYTNAAVAESMRAENEFEGFGLRGGLAGEFGGQQGGLYGYGHMIGGAVAGELSSTYQQQTGLPAGPLVVVTTSREDNRIVPTLEAELGIGWRSRNQRWRLSAGYNITALFNIASANSLVHSIRTAHYDDSDDTFTLDGLVARLEFAF